MRGTTVLFAVLVALAAVALAADDEYYKALGLSRDANEAQVCIPASDFVGVFIHIFFFPLPFRSARATAHWQRSTIPTATRAMRMQTRSSRPSPKVRASRFFGIVLCLFPSNLNNVRAWHSVRGAF